METYEKLRKAWAEKLLKVADEHPKMRVEELRKRYPMLTFMSFRTCADFLWKHGKGRGQLGRPKKRRQV